MYNAILASINIFDNYFSNNISDDELAFITTYFAASFNKMLNKLNKPLKTLIVCTYGNSISRLLYYKIYNNYNLEIISSISEYELLCFDLSNIDLIITVNDLTKYSINNVPIVNISPLLSESDFNKLDKILLINNFSIHDAKMTNLEKGILELLPKNRFICKDCVSIWDLIEVNGNLLVEDNICSKLYVDELHFITSDYKNIKKIMIAPGIIMPHAGINNSTLGVGFSLVILKKPLIIKDIVINCSLAICTNSKIDYLYAMKQLAILLSYPLFIKDIKLVNNYVDFRELCLKYLRQGDKK